MTDMENHLWDLANIITGFAVVQSLAFLYALAQNEFMKAVDNRDAQKIIIPATVVASIFYCGAVFLLGRAGTSLAESHQSVWDSVMWGRIVAILAFNGLVLYVIWKIGKKSRG